MSSRYIPVLHDRKELIRRFENCDWNASAVGRLIGCHGTAATTALKRLAPEVYEQKKAERKIRAGGR